MKRTAHGFAEGVGSAIKRTAGFIKNNSVIKLKRAALTVPAAVITTALVLMSLTFNVSYAVAVSYDGETVGYVSSTEVYDAAVEKITENTDRETKTSLSKTKAKERVTAAGTVMLDENGLTAALVETMPNVEKAVGLYANGTFFAAVESAYTAQIALSEYLAENSVGLSGAQFVKSFTLKQGYYTDAECLGHEELLLKLRVSGVEVSGTKTITETTVLEYETVEIESDEYLKGEKILLNKGENGRATVTAVATVVNGRITAKDAKEAYTVKEPIAEKVKVGTADITDRVLSFPLSKGSGYSVTSNFGEYRGGSRHYGTDIVVAYGTAIHAAAGGRVVEAGYSSEGWGNTVLIDHGNGLKTRYAHCSSLSVSYGDEVTRGDTIGYVGSTGDSDGNHLHFEAYVNGSRTDAMQLVKR